MLLILGWTGSLYPNAKQIWDTDSEKKMKVQILSVIVMLE